MAVEIEKIYIEKRERESARMCVVLCRIVSVEEADI